MFQFHDLHAAVQVSQHHLLKRTFFSFFFFPKFETFLLGLVPWIPGPALTRAFPYAYPEIMAVWGSQQMERRHIVFILKQTKLLNIAILEANSVSLSWNCSLLLSDLVLSILFRSAEANGTVVQEIV